MSTHHTPAASPWGDGLGRASIRAAQILLLLTLLVVSVYGLMQIRLVVIPVLLALILAAAIGPLVNWLRRRGWPGAAATGISFLLLLGLFGGVVTGIVFAVKSEADELVRNASKGFDQLYGYIQNGPLPIEQQQLDEARDAVIDFVTSSAAGTRAVSGLTAAGEFVTGTLLMAVILFFFLKDGDRIWAFALRGFSGERLVKARRVGIRSLEVLGGYVRGTAIIALVDSLLIGLALFLLNVPLAIPLAVIVFIGSFIPLIGATVAGALAALVALVANGPVVALMVVAAVILINQLEGNFLQPQVMSKSLNVHALVILLALAAGTILAGIVGAILSVPVAAVTWAAIKVWIGEDDELPAGHPQAIAQAEQDTADDARGLGEAPDAVLPDAVRPDAVRPDRDAP